MRASEAIPCLPGDCFTMFAMKIEYKEVVIYPFTKISIILKFSVASKPWGILEGMTRV